MIILKAVKKLITSVLKGLYAIVNVFSLQAALLVALIGVALYFTGAMEEIIVIRVIFYIAMFASFVFAIFRTCNRLLHTDNRKKRGAQIVNIPQTETKTVEQTEEPAEKVVEKEPESEISYTPPETVKSPKYYAVKQNTDYIMAEYEDRYELFFKGKDGLEKIRTDYKTR